MKSRTFLFSALCLALPTFAAVAQDAALPPLQTVRGVDVGRYMGRWYEVAKFPNRFQRQCVSDAVAEYRLLPDGRVEVGNRCNTADGSVDDVLGIARQIGAGDSPRFEVRFAPAWLSLLPMVWGDYWIVDLDSDYTLAAVSEPKREFLWILSRTPAVKPEAYQALLQRLRAQGLDVGRLQATPQQGL